MANDEKPTSIWKKEMSFRRKPADESATESSSDPAPGSIWKKDVSLRKKSKDVPAEPEIVVEPEPQPVELEPVAVVIPEPVLAPTPAVEHSWLTKPLEEISEPNDYNRTS